MIHSMIPGVGVFRVDVAQTRIRLFSFFAVFFLCSVFTCAACNMAVLVHVQCCSTSTETIRTIKDGGPRTATSTLPQLLNSVNSSTSSVLFYIH